MTRDDFRRRADLVRQIPLEVVLTSWDAVRDRCDKSRWQTPRGPLSVTGTKFFSWHHSQGGGGAIDLVMHLGGWDASQAIGWLERHLGHQLAGANPAVGTKTDAPPAACPDSPSASAERAGRTPRFVGRLAKQREHWEAAWQVTGRTACRTRPPTRRSRLSPGTPACSPPGVATRLLHTPACSAPVLTGRRPQGSM